ncbi:inactive serine/threonine-protein kinase TEX14 [Astyanax mexicanus]|uniref:inactive serine/threonine-protein kinase TEX14 n=1 Tax=Astyanax mexicanus TaxID=7994 RepID=UPI0020CB220E|nr:inactive serine/threonine-protein kinase TEX14 [Astyanax mexicanus]
MPAVPCPVRLGKVRPGGLPALLHDAACERNVRKLEKLLKKGVDVDCENNLGQTTLFCASLLGFTNVVELLLQYGANPNHRCVDGSTPVHAGVFSCKPWLLSGLLDAGGDLRLHDDQGRTPRDWAEAGAQEHSPMMLDFLQSCASHVWSLTQTHSTQDRQTTATSSKTLLHSPSLLELIRPKGSDPFVNKKLSPVCNAVPCFGFGKLCIDKSRQHVGVLASVPLIADCELVQAEDEALYSFTCGCLCCMTNYSWKGCRVTVKELQTNATQKHAKLAGYHDLLITELEFCNQLFHPHLLQLMAVSITADLQQSRLVFERVHMGSLYDILYHRRAEFPMVKVCELLAVVLQVCEALLYLHGRALVLRALSSHSIIIVHPGVAKVTGLGFIVPSEGSCQGNMSPLPLPAALYNWAAPEVIRGKKCTRKADLYSLCTLIQELYTDAVPWRCVDPRWIKQTVDTGKALSPDSAVPQPYFHFLQSGLQPQPKDRTCSLQDLRYTLRCDLKEFSKKKCGSEVCPLTLGLSMPQWSANLSVDRRSKEPESSSEVEEVCRDISYHNVLPKDEWNLSSYPFIKTNNCLDVGSSNSAVKENLAVCVPDAVSEHIGSIVLNLTMSRVSLQQVEFSLARFEQRLRDRAVYDSQDTEDGLDEVDGVSRKSKGKVVVLKAVGPPSTYRPLLQLQEGGWSALAQQEWDNNVDDDVSHYCSAVEESFLRLEGDRNVGSSAAERQHLSVLITEQPDSSYRSSDRLETQQVTTPKTAAQVRPVWTSDVREAVAQMTLGRMGTPAAPITSSESEDIEEKDHTQLEQQLKSFDGVQIENKESVDFHTVLESAEEQEESSLESDCRESPVEASSIFCTPKLNSAVTDNSKEMFETILDPEVTIEVCRPNTTVTDNQVIEDKKSFNGHHPDYQTAPEEPDQTGSSTSSKGALYTVGGVSLMQDLADLSSITCSPAQHQEWSGQNGSPPSPHRTRFPPCNSTPRSPVTCRDVDRSPSPYSRESVPLLMLDTSPWGSAPEQSVCSKLYATANLGNSNTISKATEPSQRDIFLEEMDTPPTVNQEFTTASSESRHTTIEYSRQGTDTHTAAGPEKMKAVSDEENEIDKEPYSCVSEHSDSISTDNSLDQPPDAAVSCQVVGSNEGLMLNICEASQNAEVGRSTSAPEPLEETERAHSTLDDCLQHLQDQKICAALQPISKTKALQCEVDDTVYVRGWWAGPGGDN